MQVTKYTYFFNPLIYCGQEVYYGRYSMVRQTECQPVQFTVNIRRLQCVPIFHLKISMIVLHYERTLPRPQWIPSQPSRHVQQQEPIVLTHVAPLRHGFLRHSLRSVNILKFAVKFNNKHMLTFMLSRQPNTSSYN